MKSNVLQRQRRQKEQQQLAEIQQLGLALKVMKENLLKCRREKQHLETTNEELVREERERQMLGRKKEAQITKQIDAKYRTKIREAELRSIKVAEEAQKEVEELELQFRNSMDQQFKREESLHQTIRAREQTISALQDHVFQRDQQIRKWQTKDEYQQFQIMQFESMNRGLRQESSNLKMEHRRLGSQIQLLNIQLRRVRDQTNQEQIEKRRAQQMTLNKQNELSYIHLIAGEENQMKHALLDENSQLANVASVLNSHLHQSIEEQYLTTKDLVETKEAYQRKRSQMACMKNQVRALPYYI